MACSKYTIDEYSNRSSNFSKCTISSDSYIYFSTILYKFCDRICTSFVVGMCVPAVKWGIGFATVCKAKPGTLKFGLCINVIVNLVYVVANEIVLTYFNVVVLNHAPMIAVLFGILETFIPIYIVGYIVSFLWNQPCEKITNNIVKE